MLSQIEEDFERLQYFDRMEGNIPEEEYYKFCDTMEIVKQDLDELSWSPSLSDERVNSLYRKMRYVYEKVEKDNDLYMENIVNKLRYLSPKE